VRRPAVVIAATTGLVLLLVSGRYGYHRDELYFVAAGHHPAWGYPDQPPLTPLLARLMTAVAPHSLVVLRLPSTLSAAAVVLLAGLLADRLGARRSGELVASVATALCGFVLGVGHLLSTATTSLLGWVVVTYLVVRVQQGGDRRLWLLIGLVGGITFQANVLIGFLLVALAVTTLRREALIAGSVALLLGLPYLVWQGRHGWPQLDIAHNIAGGGSTSSVPRALFLPFIALQIGPWLLPIWVTGLVRVLRDNALRCLGLSFLLLTAAFLILGGKPYYLSGLIPVLLAAGAQPVVDWLPRRGPLWLLVLSTPALLVTLPVLPVSWTGPALAVDPDAGETIGWPGFAKQVEAQRPTLVVTGNYGEAGALQRYTSLPVYSGHNGYGLWAVPPGSATALTVGIDAALLVRACSVVVEVGRIDAPVDNQEDGTVLSSCVPRRPWAQLWPGFRHFG
jgi:hypothetical protein